MEEIEGRAATASNSVAAAENKMHNLSLNSMIPQGIDFFVLQNDECNYAQYFGTEGSISLLQAVMPPATLTTLG